MSLISKLLEFFRTSSLTLPVGNCFKHFQAFHDKQPGYTWPRTWDGSSCYRIQFYSTEPSTTHQLGQV